MTYRIVSAVVDLLISSHYNLFAVDYVVVHAVVDLLISSHYNHSCANK